MCPVMLNPLATLFKPFGVASAAFGQIWYLWAQKLPFLALLAPPGDNFWGGKRFQQTVPDKACNVQPDCSLLQSIWGNWVSKWPIMVFVCAKAIFFETPCRIWVIYVLLRLDFVVENYPLFP